MCTGHDVQCISLWVKVTDLKVQPWREVGNAVSTPESGLQCWLLESLLGDGLQEAEHLGRSVSRGWLRAQSELGSVRCSGSFQDAF